MLTKQHALDDDLQSPRNVVIESNVDYLSYKFDEMDLAASWRVLTKQKLNIVNGIRLENASWRTWAKQRNNLKTVNPDTLNWLKDSDVTWLYGPLHSVIKEIGDTDRYSKPKISTTEETLGLMTSHQQDLNKKDNNAKEQVLQTRVTTSSSLETKRPNASPIQNGKPLKSALKKFTMSDLLKRSASELQISTDNQLSISQANQQLGAFSPDVIASHRQPKLRFNQYVEQCVALSIDDSSKKKKEKVRMSDTKKIINNDSETEDGTTSSDNYGDESDAGSIMITGRKNKLRSIKKIEPALLKTNSRSDFDATSDSSFSDEEEEGTVMPPISASGYHHKSSSNSSSSKYVDWDAESAESDAFVKHIIKVSKGKTSNSSKDPAADRIPTQQEMNDGNMTDQVNSDYDYEFDDDDWDTHSEHPEDLPISSSSFTQSSREEFLPVAPSPPIGCHIAHNKSHSIDNQPVVSSTIERSTSETRATDTIQHHQEQQQYNNSSLFSNIAHWASSHLWPADNK